MATDPRDQEGPVPSPTGVDPRILEILICPQTRKALAYDRVRSELVSKSARLAYSIRGGIPVMLTEEARDLDAPEADGGEAAP
jgi:uncharacterized protein YbaR (Trm112 family)